MKRTTTTPKKPKAKAVCAIWWCVALPVRRGSGYCAVHAGYPVQRWKLEPEDRQKEDRDA